MADVDAANWLRVDIDERNRLPDERREYMAYASKQVAYEEPASQRAPGDPAAGSTKVAWTLRNANGIVSAFAWALNPQAIEREHSQRNQMYATRGGFYVDDFGPGPVTITITQLVASGKWVNGNANKYSQREDVKRFLSKIYLPATQAQSPYSVYFHDNHLEGAAMDEGVYFPAGGLQIARSVEQGHVWLVRITMIGLERAPYKDMQVSHTNPARVTKAPPPKKIHVRAGDTLRSIAAARVRAQRKRDHEGKYAKHAQTVDATVKAILALNKKIRHKRVVNHKTYAAHKLVPGETILVPF